jgi:hypothetical protein
LQADSDEQRAKEAAKLDNGLTVLDTFLHKYGNQAWHRLMAGCHTWG